MKSANGAVVSEVEPGGAADLAGIRPGDRLVSINGAAVNDLIDVLVLSGQDRLVIAWVTGSSSGSVNKSREISKKPHEPLGLRFEQAVFDGIRPCRNRCVFCFVDQMPQGLRPTLYIKDDDYRLSFLQGAYVTLTNLSQADWDRIIRLRLSPLYISVHSTDPELRGRLLGVNRPRPIMPTLQRLAENRIEMHAQIVVCHGDNDGLHLEKTIVQLAEVYPALASLAVVPAGLTCHREGLACLQPHDRSSSADVLKIVHDRQDCFLPKLGTRFVFAADEWYLSAGVPLPDEEEYEDFYQLANGVGLLRLFESEFGVEQSRLPDQMNSPHRVFLVTGKSAAGSIMTGVLCRLEAVRGLMPVLVPVENRFFGTTVTVAGLLAGADILKDLLSAGAGPGDTVLIPDVALRSGERRFLDDMSLDDLAKATGATVLATRATGGGLVDALIELNA